MKRPVPAWQWDRGTIIIAAAIAVLIAGLWLAWATLAEDGDWRSFEALGVLFSGIAFLGLFVTIVLQFRNMHEQGETTNEVITTLQGQLSEQRHATQVSMTMAELSVRSALLEWRLTRMRFLGDQMAKIENARSDGPSNLRKEIEELRPKIEESGKELENLFQEVERVKASHKQSIA